MTHSQNCCFLACFLLCHYKLFLFHSSFHTFIFYRRIMNIISTQILYWLSLCKSDLILYNVNHRELIFWLYMDQNFIKIVLNKIACTYFTKHCKIKINWIYIYIFMYISQLYSCKTEWHLFTENFNSQIRKKYNSRYYCLYSLQL